MADSSKQRERGTVHVSKSFWDRISCFFRDICVPDLTQSRYDFPVSPRRRSHYTGGFLGNGVIEDTAMSLCSRKCLSCGKYKHLKHYFSLHGGREYEYCSVCRVLSSILRDTMYSPQFPNFRGGGGNDRINIKPKKPEYYDISIEDNGNDLLAGEKVVTWQRLVKDTKKRRKQRKRNKVKGRKGKGWPWSYVAFPLTQYEGTQRRHFETLWKAALDECIPPILLKSKSWDHYWKFFQQTETCKEMIAKEKKL